MDLQQEWSDLCRNVELAQTEMARLVGGSFGQIISDEVTKFCGLGAPVTEKELQTRRMQRAALSGKIAALAHAAELATFNQHAALSITTEAEVFASEQDLPRNRDDLPEFHHRLMNFLSRLTELCES